MKTQVLLVEGKSDKFVIERLRDKFCISNNFEIEPKDSVEKLIESISAELVTSKNTIGIIVDADENLQARWEAIKYRLSVKFDVKKLSPKIDGLILSENNKKIGIWLMPNNETKGKLEDFITFLVPKNDKLMPVVDNTLEYLEKEKLDLYSVAHKPKTKIKTWLAWQKDPETSMGTAITKNLLETDNELCKKFVNWLKNLFE